MFYQSESSLDIPVMRSVPKVQKIENPERTKRIDKIKEGIRSKVACIIDCHPRARQAMNLIMRQVEFMLRKEAGITGLSTQESALLMAKALDSASKSADENGGIPRAHDVESAFHDELRARIQTGKHARAIDLDSEKTQEEIGDLVGRVSYGLSW